MTEQAAGRLILPSGDECGYDEGGQPIWLTSSTGHSFIFVDTITGEAYDSGHPVSLRQAELRSRFRTGLYRFYEAKGVYRPVWNFSQGYDEDVESSAIYVGADVDPFIKLAANAPVTRPGTYCFIGPAGMGKTVLLANLAAPRIRICERESPTDFSPEATSWGLSRLVCGEERCCALDSLRYVAVGGGTSGKGGIPRETWIVLSQLEKCARLYSKVFVIMLNMMAGDVPTLSAASEALASSLTGSLAIQAAAKEGADTLAVTLSARVAPASRLGTVHTYRVKFARSTKEKKK